MTFTLALAILAVQALLGALDNLLHHELQARLPSRVSALRELRLHAAREAIYGLLFLGLAWAEWHGIWAWMLAGLLLLEIGITLADFLEEDASRRLSRFERVLHTVLAIGYGAFLAALAPTLLGWAMLPSGVIEADHGWLSWLLTLYAPCVIAWSLRNAVACMSLARAVMPAAVEPSGRTVLVTGGTGFIGGALLRQLRGEGWRVLLLTRDARAARIALGPDVLAFENLAEIPAETRIDAVVNLAGAPIFGLPWTAARKRALHGSRIATTRAVVALIARLEQRPAVLVSASAVGIYGLGDAPVDESAPPQAIFQSRLCEDWEREAMRAGDVGVRVALLRFGVVLGRDGGVFQPLLLAARLGLGAVLGNGRQIMSWIHRDDAVALIGRAIADPRFAGPVNATAPEPVSQADFARGLAVAMGRPLWLRVPDWQLRLLLGEMAQLLLDGQCVVPARAVALGYRFRFTGLASALADLTADERAALSAESPRIPPRTSRV